MAKARRSIHLLNWAFEPQTPFAPGLRGQCREADRFGPFLRALADDRPELDIRLLCWQSALPVAATQDFFPIKARECFAGSGVKFRLDGALPIGASHHQKALIVDDSVAFCGGADIGPDRWDTPLHKDDDDRRSNTRGVCHPSRHEVMCLVDGPPATSLGELFRLRWRRATGETVPSYEPCPPAAWPDHVSPDFRDIAVGLSITAPKWRSQVEIRESEALTLAMIAAAKTTIYMENQYFTSPVVAEALAQQLAEPVGPEVVLISTRCSPSYFDKLTMDRTRNLFVRRLRAADRHGRLRLYYPVTGLGRTIIVHAKLAIIDDRLLRVGSSNMNNRSFGFDSECDLSLEVGETPGRDNRLRIGEIRDALVGHWLGRSVREVRTAVDSAGSLGAAIERLRDCSPCRLVPLEPEPLGPATSVIARLHLGDPASTRDSWRPWLRAADLRSAFASTVARLQKGALPHPREVLPFDAH